ncbi:hypothetical protein ACPPVU_25400 [Mucilaginibacter sp. McL0603]|uniref:hypothetical protein n=1 Tax=Mucilaginibacter sp. McL0603 TaxID=3415670 RepID=UPI003CE9626A
MRTIKELNKKKVPVVRIDETLDKYNDVVLFPEKVAQANEMLRKVGLPKEKNDQTSISK